MAVLTGKDNIENSKTSHATISPLYHTLLSGKNISHRKYTKIAVKSIKKYISSVKMKIRILTWKININKFYAQLTCPPNIIATKPRTHAHARTHARTRTHTHARTHTHVRTRTYAHARTHTHARTRTHSYWLCDRIHSAHARCRNPVLALLV